MRALTVAQIRKLEERAKQLGLTEIVLIENASSNLFRVISDLNLGQKVVVVAGRGNNGADVLSCARKLLSHGLEVKVVVLEEKPLGKEALAQKAILERLKLPVCSIGPDSIKSLKTEVDDCDFIVEGILGIGLKGALSLFLKEAILTLNQSGKKIVSCDLPSGLSPDSGTISDQAIKANYTVTFIAPKQGFFINQGPAHCGEVRVVDIGISREVLEGL